LREAPRLVRYQRRSGQRHALSALTEDAISRIIEMAWEDRTPFEAIEASFGLAEAEVIALMRRHMKRSSFKMWRERMSGRTTKHKALRTAEVTRAYCPMQYKPRQSRSR
jgi:uncharacterized protein (TIGR03643 family)